MALGKRSTTDKGATSRKKSRNAPATRRATRSMTTDAARKAVLDTSELLEQIILCLPMTNIFVIQRVCQKFKAVIATSPNIQTKLFLRLRADVPEEAWALDTHSGPLPRHPDNVRFRKVDVNSKGTLYKPVVLNPLLQRRPLFSRTSSAADRLFRSDSLGETVEMMFPQSHFGSQLSFLKTYITDPPCHTAKAAIAAAYLIDPKDDPEEDSVYGVISGEEISSDQGLTIGDVIRARGDVRMHWDAIGLGDSEDSDAQLEEVIQDTGSLVTEGSSSPILRLQLSGVVVPTEREWSEVSLEGQEATSSS